MDSEAPRVCVVGSGWQFTSGISYYTCHLANALSQNHSVSVILMRRLIPRRFYPGRDRVGVPLHAMSYEAGVTVFDGVDWFAVPSLMRAMVFLRRSRPDLVVFQWWTGAVLHSYLALLWAARRAGATVVVEFHEVQDTGELRMRGVGWYVRKIGRSLFASADGYVAHSDIDRDMIASTYAISSERVRVVPHGPYPQHGTGTGAVACDEERPTRLLFFGTIRPYKGLEHLVEAFDGLSVEDAGRFELSVVGETWEGWTGPLAAIDSSRHRSRIHVVNRYVSDDEVAAAFAAADVVVLPYTRSSASGPLHIAMAHGLPVILSDVGGLRAGAEGYDGILWVPSADPVALRQALLKTPGLRGQRFLDPRSWDDAVEALEALARGRASR